MFRAGESLGVHVAGDTDVLGRTSLREEIESDAAFHEAMSVIAANAYVLPRGRPSAMQAARGRMSVQLRRSTASARSAT